MTKPITEKIILTITVPCKMEDDVISHMATSEFVTEFSVTERYIISSDAYSIFKGDDYSIRRRVSCIDTIMDTDRTYCFLRKFSAEYNVSEILLTMSHAKYSGPLSEFRFPD